MSKKEIADARKKTFEEKNMRAVQTYFDTHNPRASVFSLAKMHAERHVPRIKAFFEAHLGMEKARVNFECNALTSEDLARFLHLVRAKEINLNYNKIGARIVFSDAVEIVYLDYNPVFEMPIGINLREISISNGEDSQMIIDQLPPRLEKLQMYRVHLQAPLPPLPESLRVLSLECAHLSDLTWITPFPPRLEMLLLGRNPELSDISLLRLLPSSTLHLDLHSTSVADLGPLAGVKLESLCVALSLVADLTPINRALLEHINVSWCPLPPGHWEHFANTAPRRLDLKTRRAVLAMAQAKVRRLGTRSAMRKLPDVLLRVLAGFLDDGEK